MVWCSHFFFFLIYRQSELSADSEFETCQQVSKAVCSAILFYCASEEEETALHSTQQESTYMRTTLSQQRPIGAQMPMEQTIPASRWPLPAERCAHAMWLARSVAERSSRKKRSAKTFSDRGWLTYRYFRQRDGRHCSPQFWVWAALIAIRKLGFKLPLLLSDRFWGMCSWQYCRARYYYTQIHSNKFQEDEVSCHIACAKLNLERTPFCLPLFSNPCLNMWWVCEENWPGK